MRRKFSISRLCLLAVMLVAVGYLASTGMAQDGGAEAEAPVEQAGTITVLTRLIIGHIDFVTVIILILSMVGLSLIITSALRLRQSAFMPDETTEEIRKMIEGRQFKELIEYTENDPTFIAKAINPALKRAPSFSAMKEAMETAIGEQTAEQFRKIEYLNIIGNLGPLLGLMGTVIGMILAFDKMQSSAAGADPKELAGGIATALAHTFMGLFLAVPALAAFGILRTITDRLTIRAALVCEELLLMIKPAEAKPGAGAARPAGQAAPGAAAPRPRATPVPQPPPSPAPQA